MRTVTSHVRCVVALSVAWTLTGAIALGGEYPSLALRIVADAHVDSTLVDLSQEGSDRVIDGGGHIAGEWVPVAGESHSVITLPSVVARDGRLLILRGPDDVVDSVKMWAWGVDEYGKQVLEAFFNDEGKERLERLTGANQGRRIAIIANGEVVAAPEIRSVLSSCVIVPGIKEESVPAGTAVASFRQKGFHLVLPSLVVMVLAAGVTVLAVYPIKGGLPTRTLPRSFRWVMMAAGLVVGALVVGVNRGVGTDAATRSSAVIVIYHISILWSVVGGGIGAMVGWACAPLTYLAARRIGHNVRRLYRLVLRSGRRAAS